MAQLLAALVVLASVGTASAECAWVLWLGGLNPPPGIEAWQAWTPQRSYKTLEPCEREVDRSNEGVLARNRNQQYQWQYVCLPDTVDPRGPKAK